VLRLQLWQRGLGLKGGVIEFTLALLGVAVVAMNLYGHDGDAISAEFERHSRDLAWPGVLYSLRAVDLAAETPQVDGPPEPWPANAYQNEEKADPHVLRKNADSHHDHRGPEHDQQDGRHRDDEAYAVAASIWFAHK